MFGSLLFLAAAASPVQPPRALPVQAMGRVQVRIIKGAEVRAQAPVPQGARRSGSIINFE